MAVAWNTYAPPAKSVVKHRPATASTYVNPLFDSLLAAFEDEVSSLQATSGTPGAAIAVVKDSSIVYLRTFGVKVVGGTDSIDAHTVFRIASVSKCFASFLTGMLVADGTLSWDDPVVKYVPSFQLKSPEHTKHLTLRHVLSQTTGLPYHTYTNLVEEGLELPILLDKLKGVDLFTAPGQEYSYQNVAYSLIGEVLRSATGKPYEQLMAERVFAPLGMEQASMNYNTLIANPNIARPHRRRHGRWMPASITNTYYNVAPAGGINASITDMAQWMIALLGNRNDVIADGTLSQLYAPEVKAPSKNRNYGRENRVSASYYGLGWRVLHYPDDTLIYHGGYVNGYRSEVAFHTSDGVAVCVLANAPGALSDKSVPAFFDLFHRYREAIMTFDRRKRAPALETAAAP